MWENDVLPDMGRNGQKIIDEKIENTNYDIFIGIMKNRFGQPTPKAGSGTEHEFNNAIERTTTSKNSSPRILFFFGTEKVDLNSPDIENIIAQNKKVQDFKKRLSSNGLYINFSSKQDFSEILKQKLELFAKEITPLSKPEEKIQEVDTILKRLNEDLNQSLKTYNESSPIWIDPIISAKREVPENPTKNGEYRISIDSIINKPSNIVIKAPSEFGLTSLAHHLKLNAWKAGKTFLYIDTKETKKHKIVKDIIKESAEFYNTEPLNLDCILLDSVCFEANGTMQMLKNVCEEFKDLPIIIFNTQGNNFFLKSDEDDKVEIKRDFTSYYLLPLPQNDVRKIVNSYTKIKPFEEDRDILLNKVTKDLETLNMHRTAKNCISVLRASSKIGNEYNPINRTKLLEIILTTIFEEYEIPTYHDKKPDVKDVSFVLGYLCELLVKRENFEFSEEYFKNELKEFCQKNYIELDLSYLLNALIDNSIIGRNSFSEIFYFKNSYWVFYFIAQRMNMDKTFLNSIYDDKKYVDFPEVIEFYTGIDRNKEDALTVLLKDLKETLETVRTKVKISDNLNPYKSIDWTPDISILEQEEAKIGENVISSGLPDEVKDKYEDKNYNQIRPYNQVINSVIRDYSFLLLMRQLSATSRALRNSDFVNAQSKKEVLDNIVLSWNEITKLLIVLSPLLADKGKVAFDGASFHLDDESFRFDDPEEKRLAVLTAVPSNVVKFFKDDLFSTKMGPLLIDRAKNESNSLLKHELMLLLVSERPKYWNKVIDNYIVSLDKNSFFLSDVYHTLKFNKDYKATEIEEKRIIELLAKKCRAKHIFKNNNPNPGLIRRLAKMDKDSKY